MWRGANGPTDRIFSGLAYMLPMASALPFGSVVLGQFSFLVPFVALVAPFSAFTSGFGGLLVFILLIALVINNQRISHFIRYNVMQSLLLMIVLTLLELVFFRFFGQLLGGVDFFTMILQVLSNTIFLGTLGACCFSIVQSALGRYPEIPALSDVVYTQVR